MRTVARAYTYLYELSISLAALGLAWLALSGGLHLRLPMFYAEGARLTGWLLAAGTVGVVTVLLAATGVARWPLSLWALLVLVVLFRGYFLSSYTFSGAYGFWWAVWFTGGALAAFLCSLARPRKSASLSESRPVTRSSGQITSSP
ncbi:MAG: hypothetical protein ABSF98_16030 [Bryobacteraceae bacterium]|jgi:hypothetical protein